MIASTIGTLRYYQAIGQGYADLFRGSFTASSFITAGAAWLGVGKVGAIAIGVASMFVWILLAIGFGWLIWKYRVIHNTLDREWKNSPATVRQIELLEMIARNTRRGPHIYETES